MTDAYRIRLELCQTITPATMVPAVLFSVNAGPDAPFVWVRADALTESDDTAFFRAFSVPLGNTLYCEYSRFKEATRAAVD